MRNKLNSYLMLSVFCLFHFFPGLNNFCAAQVLRSENAGIKDARSNARNTEPEQTEKGDVIRIETDFVINEVLVFDKNGKPITDLKIGDFIVKEDGERQEISAFSFGDGENLPRSIVLIIDYSGSQLPYIKTSIEAAKVLVDKVNPRDRMAIVTDDVELLQDFTTDKDLLKEKLESLKTNALSGKLGQSRQYSALMKVLGEMFAEIDFRPVIIFQTDGDELMTLKGERISKITPKEKRPDFCLDNILTTVEKTRATVYSIIPGIRFFGIPEKEYLERSRAATINNERVFYELKNKNFNPEKLKLSGNRLKAQADLFNRQQSALNQIAQMTGGLTNFLEQPEQADRIYAEILSKMNRRYLLGYYPTDQSRDGRRRTVSIELPRYPEYKIWGRKTYILDDK